jgi:RNA polymerase sigma-70 factor (ECF subfamily)
MTAEEGVSVRLRDVTAVDRTVDSAIEAFVLEHYDRLLGLARLVCRDATDAADAVQVGLEQAWRGRTTLRDLATLRPWLDRIVVREAMRLARRRTSWVARILPDRPTVQWIEPPDRGPEPATYVALRQAFATLSPTQRAVVALHLHLGYTIAETAALVGAPQETVRSRVRLARERLRDALQEHER